MVDQEAGTLWTLRVPDQRLGGQDTQDIPNRSSEYSKVTPEDFRLVPYPQSQSEQTEEEFTIMITDRPTHQPTNGHYYFLKLPTTGRSSKI